MTIQTQQEAEDAVYRSYLRVSGRIRETSDRFVRRPIWARRLLDALGSPDSGRRIILVTGSKGKGSTARYIAMLLGRMGHRVGLFTSPHLVHFNERIRIGGRAISEADFIRVMGAVEPELRRLEARLENDEYIGPIGITLAAALLYFREQRTDFDVIECGRGGAYDDTNVLANEWAVITAVMEEHVKQLGPGLSDIVRHKAGIVKPCTRTVVIGRQREDVLPLLRAELAVSFASQAGERAVAETESGRLRMLFGGEHFGAAFPRLEAGGTKFDVWTGETEYKGLTVPALGLFQADNAAAAIQLCEQVSGCRIDEALAVSALSAAVWPGRCEVVREHPTVILDGAIHRDSARYTAEVVRALNPRRDRKVASIIGVPADRDYAGVIGELSGVSDAVYVTRPDVSHLVFPTDALEAAERHKPGRSRQFPVLREAVAHAMDVERADLVLIVGTQTLIGNAKRLFGQSLLDLGG